MFEEGQKMDSKGSVCLRSTVSGRDRRGGLSWPLKAECGVWAGVVIIQPRCAD